MKWNSSVENWKLLARMGVDDVIPSRAVAGMLLNDLILPKCAYLDMFVSDSQKTPNKSLIKAFVGTSKEIYFELCFWNCWPPLLFLICIAINLSICLAPANASSSDFYFLIKFGVIGPWLLPRVIQGQKGHLSNLYITFWELKVHYFRLVSMPCIAVAHTSSPCLMFTMGTDPFTMMEEGFQVIDPVRIDEK